MNNIGGPFGGGDPYSAFINSTNKSAPSVPVTPRPAGASSAVPKDSASDAFLSSPAGNTAIVAANASLMPKGKLNNDKGKMNNDWGSAGALEETEETGTRISFPSNTKGGVFFEAVSELDTKGVGLVKQVLIGSIKQADVRDQSSLLEIINNV
jgi:hypothetical protein